MRIKTHSDNILYLYLSGSNLVIGESPAGFL